MNVEWNYSDLAKAYLKRPQYSSLAIRAMVATGGLNSGAQVADIGAGVGHLTKHLVDYAFEVKAVEPNNEMRNLGKSQFIEARNLEWLVGSGESTNLSSSAFDLVTFGSSFNVCNRQLALEETARILKKNGWFACMWNHRDLTDPIQSRIEKVIKDNLPEYNYGTRREDQSSTIEESGLFSQVVYISSKINHQQSFTDLIEAWKSHATLQRQAGEKFTKIILKIEETLINEFNIKEDKYIEVPYETKIWMAQKKN